MRRGLNVCDLAEVVSAEVDDQLIGKVYWVIGNVAFLCNKVQEGLEYHELAAATFSPARNLDVWAKFNKASAAMRLAADVADADTLRCIERAELATDVIGGSANDLPAVEAEPRSLELPGRRSCRPLSNCSTDLCGAGQDRRPKFSARPACCWAGPHAAIGNHAAARENLLQAADHFETAGAPQRADQAREYLAAEA